MNKRKNGVLGVIALVIVIAAYSIVIFALFKQEQRNNVFWSVYIFTMVALLMQFVTLYIIGSNQPKARDVFLGLPLVRHGLVYLLVQFVAGIVILLIKDCSILAAIIVQIIILAAFALFAIAAMIGKNVVSTEAEARAQKVFYIKSIETDIQGLLQRCDDYALRKDLRALIETVRYSDPISHASLAGIENAIERKVAELGEKVMQKRNEPAQAAIQELEMLFADRNRKCKLLK